MNLRYVRPVRCTNSLELLLRMQRPYFSKNAPSLPTIASQLRSLSSARTAWQHKGILPPNRILLARSQWKRIGPLQTLRFESSDGKHHVMKTRSRFTLIFYKAFFYFGFGVAAIGGLIVAFFAYDASTYRVDPINEDIAISEIALTPRIGGPKNLPIAEHLVDDDDSPEKKSQKHKPKLVILGTGWGSVALLKTINPDEYHITVVSPSNHFLFTPMLPSATVGTLEMRSLVEPVRRIISRVHGHFLKAMAEDVEFSEKLVECSAVNPDGTHTRFYLPYDKLVIGVGMYKSEFL
jgi:NADH dehydrogenase